MFGVTRASGDASAIDAGTPIAVAKTDTSKKPVAYTHVDPSEAGNFRIVGLTERRIPPNLNSFNLAKGSVSAVVSNKNGNVKAGDDLGVHYGPDGKPQIVKLKPLNSETVDKASGGSALKLKTALTDILAACAPRLLARMIRQGRVQLPAGATLESVLSAAKNEARSTLSGVFKATDRIPGARSDFTKDEKYTAEKGLAALSMAVTQHRDSRIGWVKRKITQNKAEIMLRKIG